MSHYYHIYPTPPGERDVRPWTADPSLQSGVGRGAIRRPMSVIDPAERRARGVGSPESFRRGLGRGIVRGRPTSPMSEASTPPPPGITPPPRMGSPYPERTPPGVFTQVQQSGSTRKTLAEFDLNCSGDYFNDSLDFSGVPERRSNLTPMIPYCRIRECESDVFSDADAVGTGEEKSNDTTAAMPDFLMKVISHTEILNQEQQLEVTPHVDSQNLSNVTPFSLEEPHHMETGIPDFSRVPACSTPRTELSPTRGINQGVKRSADIRMDNLVEKRSFCNPSPISAQSESPASSQVSSVRVRQRAPGERRPAPQVRHARSRTRRRRWSLRQPPAA